LDRFAQNGILLIATLLSRVAVLVLCISPRDGSNGGSGDGGTGVTKVSPSMRSVIFI
jgi:hypothetical protein